jgi:DNA recombination protein RmuC
MQIPFANPVWFALSLAAVAALSAFITAIVVRQRAALRESALQSQLALSQEQLRQAQLQLQSQQQQMTTAHEQLREREQQLIQLRTQLEDTRRSEATALRERDVAQQSAQQLTFVQGQLKEKEQQADTWRSNEGQARAELAALRAQVEQERIAAQEKIALLNDARNQLTLEFQNLANRIFAEKSESFRQHNATMLDQTLLPLKQQLGEFRQRVDEIYDKDSKERLSLQHELLNLKQLNQQMTQEALNLTRALKGESKTQGNWGEVILEKVLEDSGLRKGHEYEVQVKLQDDDGRRRYPDVVVRLPDNKDIVVDAKVSLTAYERYCSSDDESERKEALKQHTASLRSHVQNLSIKDYERLPGIRTLDFVFIFVPIEAAFMLAVEHDQSLFRDAFDKNIIFVSPTTLLATLRTVNSIWRYERQNRNAEQIASRAGSLHDQFVLVLESLDDLGKLIQKTQSTYDKARERLATGRGNVLSQIDQLRVLGAKAKKRLPGTIAELNPDQAQGADTFTVDDAATNDTTLYTETEGQGD